MSNLDYRPVQLTEIDNGGQEGVAPSGEVGIFSYQRSSTLIIFELRRPVAAMDVEIVALPPTMGNNATGGDCHVE